MQEHVIAAPLWFAKSEPEIVIFVLCILKKNTAEQENKWEKKCTKKIFFLLKATQTTLRYWLKKKKKDNPAHDTKGANAKSDTQRRKCAFRETVLCLYFK